MGIEVGHIRDEESGWARQILRDHWASEVVVTRGRAHRADRLPALVCMREGRRAGLLIYRIEEDECEIVTLNALERSAGIGTALLQEACGLARAASCWRIWVITTNDNTPAMRFYERRGFTLARVHRGAIESSRRLKPEIPLRGIGGVPIRDEVELELRLGP